MKNTLLISLLLLAACHGEFRPLDVEGEDICSYCKMAISEKRYAAEFINKDGEASKFDEIGCMIRHLESVRNKGTIAAYFVVDFDSRQWIKAAEAHYVRSPEFKTPMSGGIVAFKDKSKAEDAAASCRGELFRFSDLLAQPWFGEKQGDRT